MSGLREAVAALAGARRVPLSPHWDGEIPADDLLDDAAAAARATAALGWRSPRLVQGRPRPDELPLLVHDEDHGWLVAEQWLNETTFSLAASVDGPARLDWSPEQRLFDFPLPDALQGDQTTSARMVIWRAVIRHKHVLVSAGLATVVANVLTLATSLYSMQLFDRVIPLGSVSTLVVLTVGVGIALLLDFILRTLRATMIEREAMAVDSEVAEYFFARAQAVRLDARPPGIGTLAAQLRGLDQVRSVMSSGTLFLLADLPFAVFFIAVIAQIGGAVAWVPIVSLPLAIGLALLLGLRIRKATDRAQVSGNRKNGMLVEALDAAETVKANRGGWLLLGRWNRLVREVHHYDEPVRRLTAVAGALFSMLQQVAYVALMAMGALAVGEGSLTTGGLLACSIIAGRINGPLVATLPNLIVQWGYARSSLRALDAILALPLDAAAAGSGVRPAQLRGALHAENLTFAYPGAREGIEVPALEIRPGERVAVIGGVGSGKTTLLRLLAGLFKGREGRVEIGGLEIGQVADDILRGHVGYLPQDVRLVNGTLRDNLTMGLERVGDDAILEVARRTGLESLIAGHPLGLDLPIHEGGRGLSGGQRSLVGLTRLVLARPAIWLLDEPTAALDQASEVAVLDAVDRALPEGAMLVVVTHKFQLLPRFSRVIVMQRGRVALDGPTAKVLSRLAPREPAAQRPRPAASAVAGQA